MQSANSQEYRLSKMVSNIWLKSAFYVLGLLVHPFHTSVALVAHYASDFSYFLFSKMIWKSLEGKLESRAKTMLATFLSAGVFNAFCWNIFLTFHSDKNFCARCYGGSWLHPCKVQHSKCLCMFSIYHTIKINLFRLLSILRSTEKHNHQFLSRAAPHQLKINYISCKEPNLKISANNNRTFSLMIFSHQKWRETQTADSMVPACFLPFFLFAQ